MIAKCFELFESSSLPGVPVLTRSKQTITRIVWLVFTIVLVGLSINYVIQTVQMYYNFEVVTNIKVFSDNAPKFPTISICMQLNDNQTSVPDANDVIVFCSFEGNTCNGTDFEFFQDSFRISYRFNSGRNAFNRPSPVKNSTRNLIYFGLTVLFDPKYIKATNNIGYKIYVFINNASSLFIPHRPYFAEDINFLLNGFNAITIEREFIHKLGDPYNTCVKQDTDQNNKSILFQYFIQNNVTYQQRHMRP